MGPHSPQLAGMDLNLLVVLRELLRERNVTRAAERIGLTQPAASAALARLRRVFGDELLVREGRTYVLSPLAVQLTDQVEAACAAAERVFAVGSRFDPATSSREFTLVMADYTIAVIGEELSQLFAEEAPRAKLHVRLVREALAANGADAFRGCDGIVAPPASRPPLAYLRSIDLFEDRWVCVVSADHAPLAPLRLDDLARRDWVIPYHRDQGLAPFPPVSRQLALLGIDPNVAVQVESYQAVPTFVAGTNRIALLQEKLATKLAPQLGLRVLPCPGDPEPIVETLWWPEDFEHDPPHAWLRDLLVRASGRTLASAPSGARTGRPAT